MPQDSASPKLRLVRHCVVCYSVLVGAAALPALAESPSQLPTNRPALIPPPEVVLNRPPASKVPLALAMDTRGDLSLQDATIEKSLFSIAAIWKVNIVVGKDIKGTVSCVYHQAPLREVLDAILLANGYSYRAVGDSLVVQKASEVGSANPLFQSASIAITHSDVQEVVEGARLLLSQQGQLRALESAHSILVVDFADRVATIRDFVARMDVQAAKSTGGIPAESYKRLTTAYFHTQYIPVDNAREPLTTVLSQEGRVGTMPEENRLIVTDYASNIAMVKKVLEKIDRPLPQVRITALIYDVSLEDVEQLGLNWNSVAKGNNLDADGNPQQALTFVSNTLAPFGPTAAGGTATIQSLTRNFDITNVALLLQNANDARLLANPNVTVMENRVAEMNSVQEIPFQQLTQSGQGGGGTSAIATTAFKEVGIKLKVTPTIASDGTVQMDVQQEFSRLVSQNDNGPPTIDTRNASTVVRVSNRQTLVIGGLRQRSDTGTFNGIPFLKDVRYIGCLFRSRSTNVRESELLIFLMPEIVAYDEPGSSREFLSQETINCRLDRVPVAEGCGGPCGGNCGPGMETYHELVPLPPVEEGQQSVPSARFQQQPPSKLQVGAAKPFRSGFQDRYRAEGGTDESRQSLRGSNPQAKKAPSNPWQRLFGS